MAIASLEVKEGDNPAMLTNANTNLRNLPKTDSDYQGGGAGKYTQSDTRSNNTGGGSSPTSLSPPSSSK